MRFRLSVFAAHLACSFLIVSLLIFGAWWGWYFSPAWHITGVGSILGLILFVDMGLGPFATLVIASPRKEWAVLRRDIFFIVIVQLSALSIGVYTLWNARPLYYAFSGDRISLIRNSDFSQVDIDKAVKLGKTEVPKWNSRPKWIWAPLPENKDEAAKIVNRAIISGVDVTNMPEYFRPFSDATDDLESKFLPLANLRGHDGLSVEEYEQRLAKLGVPQEALAYIPIVGPERDGSVIFDRKNKKPIDFWPVVAWPSR